MMTTDLERALELLGELLADREQAFEVYAIGGGSLLLLGFIDRPTADLDLVAIVRGGAVSSAAPLPARLEEASVEVAGLLELREDWLNAGPADLLRFGLPHGYDERIVTRRFGALTVHLAGRFDQICFKLYAAVDQGPRSKHFDDLRRLQPTPEELLVAARWTRTHDPSEAFLDQLEQALAMLGVTDHDGL
jgi:hypothetical protein